MLSFQSDFKSGQQLALLRHFGSSAQAITPDTADTFFSPNYQQLHPKTIAALTPLFSAFKNIKSIEGKRLDTLSQAQKQQLLHECIFSGQQLAALSLLGHGAYLEQDIINKLNTPAFQRTHPLTSAALTPFVQYYQPQPQIIPSGDRQQDEQRRVEQFEASLVDLRSFNAGDGGFVKQESLSHEQIQALKAKHQHNPVLKAAFSLVEGFDVANRNDILSLCSFLHEQNAPRITAPQVIESIDRDILKLCRIKNEQGDRMSLPVHDSFEQMLNSHGVLNKAKRILREHPEIINGQLHGKLADYRNKDLGGLKAALAYAAKLKGAEEHLFEHLKGFYKANVPHGEAYQSSLMFGKHLYVPANGYILGADQTSANDPIYDRHDQSLDVAVTDCSGFMTNIMRKVRPDLTWLKDHRLVSWDLEKAHDAKFLNRSDLVNEGPLQVNGKRRAYLTAAEKTRLRRWKENNPAHYNTVDRGFDTVKNRDEIRPGDFIVYRQRRGSEVSSDTGHVAMVVEHSKGTNNAILLEYTRSNGHDGVGFTQRPICYRPYGNTTWETRILRPKV